MTSDRDQDDELLAREIRELVIAKVVRAELEARIARVLRDALEDRVGRIMRNALEAKVARVLEESRRQELRFDSVSDYPRIERL